MKDKLWFFVLLPVPAGLPVPRGRAPGVPEQVRGRPRLREAQLADQHQEQADVRLPRRLLPDPLRRHQLQRPHRPQHDQGGARPQPVAQRDLHRRSSRTRPPSRPGSPASTARTTPTRSQDGEPRIKPRYLDLDTGRDHGRHLLLVRRRQLEDGGLGQGLPLRRQVPGGSHDFKFGVQFNEGGGDYVSGYNDYICTYSGVPAYALRLRDPRPRGGQDAGIGLFVDDTFRVSDRLTLNLGVRYDYSKASFDSYPLLDANGNETGREHAGRGRALHLEHGLAAHRLQLEAHQGRQDGAQGPLRPLLPRRGHRASSTTWRPPRPAVVVLLGALRRAGQPHRRGALLGQHEPRGGPELQESLHRPVRGGLRAPARQGRRPRRSTTCTNGASATEAGGHRGQLHAGHLRRQRGDGRDAARTSPCSDATPTPRIRSSCSPIPSEMLHALQRRHRAAPEAHVEQLAGDRLVRLREGRGPAGLEPPEPDPGAGGPAPGTSARTRTTTSTPTGVSIGDRPISAKLQLVYQLPAGFLVGANYTYQQGRPWARQAVIPRTSPEA